MTIKRLLSEADSHELSEWQAFFSLEPFSMQAQYHGAGIISATAANVNRGKGQRAYVPADFMPDFDRRRRQDPREMERLLKAFAFAHGARKN